MSELAPYGLMQIQDEAEFATKYIARLERIGVERIEQRFAGISAAHDGRGLVLLCYEPAGEPCHRRLFATWLEQQTGQHVPELEGQLGLLIP